MLRLLPLNVSASVPPLTFSMLAPEPSVRSGLRDVVSALGVDPEGLAALPAEQKLAVAGGIRAFLRQAVDLVESPDRAPGWTLNDPVFLQSQGRMSSPIDDEPELFVRAWPLPSTTSSCFWTPAARATSRLE